MKEELHEKKSVGAGGVGAVDGAVLVGAGAGGSAVGAGGCERVRPLKMAVLVAVALGALLALVACQGLDGYRRSYTLNYQGPEGQTVGVGVTLDPVKRSGK